ncbi:ABC transporter permease [Chondrinema litorale]|uniref:ABC transporter permease n=1 Tax=Chondrinema litorale TaxID=2994555 RepID=UPI002542FFF8|nr:FtsX-like permease family protein [Chondrinema litorale]UZR94694.1 ABC transporter permease [Chondrinema litorale]
MLLSYLKIAFRMLIQQKWYTAIHIAGLSIGIACSLLVTIYISHELTYEKFNKDAERTYRINYDDPDRKIAITPNIVGPTAQAELAAVEVQTRIMVSGNTFFTYNDKSFEERFYYADSTFFDIFSFKFLLGNKPTSLNEPNELILTESIAKKHFGKDWKDKDVIGQVFMVDDKDPYKISGVIQDLPDNTDFSFKVLASFKSIDWAQEEQWGNANYYTYIKLTPNANPKETEQAMLKLFAAKQGFSIADLPRKPFLQPLLAIHTYGDLYYDYSSITDKDYLIIFGAIAFLLLTIACINYINLATAKAVERAREIGVRKVMGANKNQLLFQFLGEAFIITLSAFLLAVFLSSHLITYLNDLINRNLSLESFFTVENTLYVIAGILFITIAAGAYPALVLTKFQPVKVLKKNFKSSQSGVILRKVLVVFQYTASILLLTGTLIVKKQIDYIHNKDAGFEKQVFVLSYDKDIMGNQTGIRNKLMEIPGINKVSFSSNNPANIGSVWNMGNANIEEVSVSLVSTDEYYLNTCKIQLIAGKDFNKNTPPFINREDENDERLNEYILNQSGVKALGLTEENAIGQIIEVSERRGEVIGIVKNFHFESLHNAIEPLVITYDKNRVWDILVNMDEKYIRESIPQIESLFKEIAPSYPFDYYFVSDSYNNQYKAEERLGTISSILSIIAIIIACLGLLGLTSFTTVQKAKEISIRKVFGASIRKILILLSKDFINLLSISCLIALPISWYMSQNWLSNFIFRIDITIWLVILPILIIAFITIGTISIQLIRTAKANPVDALRKE